MISPRGYSPGLSGVPLPGMGIRLHDPARACLPRAHSQCGLHRLGTHLGDLRRQSLRSPNANTHGFSAGGELVGLGTT
ncbi:MAG: hypothetical protein AAF670_07950, partial [Planctomycetota bacterium]